MTLDELIRAGRNFATPAEACAILEADERTIYDGIKNGQIPSTRVGTRHKIPVRWLRQQAGLDDAGQPSPSPADPEAIAAVVADRVVAKLAAALAVLAVEAAPGQGQS